MVDVPNSESQCACSTGGGQGRCMAEMDQEACILEALPEDYARTFGIFSREEDMIRYSTASIS